MRSIYCLLGTKHVQLGHNYGAHHLGNCVLIFLFLGSSLAIQEPKLQLFEVWDMMVRQIIIASIAMVIISTLICRCPRTFNISPHSHIHLSMNPLHPSMPWPFWGRRRRRRSSNLLLHNTCISLCKWNLCFFALKNVNFLSDNSFWKLFQQGHCRQQWYMTISVIDQKQIFVPTKPLKSYHPPNWPTL